MHSMCPHCFYCIYRTSKWTGYTSFFCSSACSIYNWPLYPESRL